MISISPSTTIRLSVLVEICNSNAASCKVNRSPQSRRLLVKSLPPVSGLFIHASIISRQIPTVKDKIRQKGEVVILILEIGY